MNQFSYQSEKLALARYCLMLPHTEGEARSIASAFQACSAGFREMNREKLDDNARQWVSTIEGFMNADGINDPKREGAFLVKARTLTSDDQRELSRAVDELAHWFRGYE